MSEPDPLLVVVWLALTIWLLRLIWWDYLKAKRWQWTIADWLWLTLWVGVAITYVTLLGS